jgi:hypothetical protein
MNTVHEFAEAVLRFQVRYATMQQVRINAILHKINSLWTSLVDNSHDNLFAVRIDSTLGTKELRLTHSPSFCCAGTPISSNVFGPLPGGLAGIVDAFAGGLAALSFVGSLASGFFPSGGLEGFVEGARGAGLSTGIVCELCKAGA